MAGQIQRMELVIAQLGQSIHERKCRHMGQVADGAEDLIVEMGVHGQQDRLGGLPQLLDTFQRARVGLLRRR